MTEKKNQISVVIPLYNEEGSLEELYAGLKEVSLELERPFQLIFIDDGSTDDSLAVLKKIQKEDDNTTIISFSPHYS